MAVADDDFPEVLDLRLRALPSDAPRAVRFRHLLKTALRFDGFECESVTPVPKAAKPEAYPRRGCGPCWSASRPSQGD